MRRQILVVLIGLVVAAGCGTSEGQLSSSITPSVAADLTVAALVEECSGACTVGTMYVHDTLFRALTLTGDETPMPVLVRDAISEVYGGAVFVGSEGADALFGDDGLVDGGRGVLVSIGPIEELASDVIGIDIGVTTARDGSRYQTVQFRWTGSSWVQADSEDTGVTVTSAVS